MFKSEYLKPSTPHLQEDEIHERAPPGKPAFQPYWGKPAVRNDREDRGNVGIIEARSAPRSYPTPMCPIRYTVLTIAAGVVVRPDPMRRGGNHHDAQPSPPKRCGRTRSGRRRVTRHRIS